MDTTMDKPLTDSSEVAGKQDGSLKTDRSSPEASCVICLGKLENKSFTDSCFHQFCFTCLLEWSKVKAECPLCKQPFKSIIHNVRSIEDYDQYHLRSDESHTSWESPDGRRFRYRSTLTAERRCELALERLLLGRVHRQPSLIFSPLWNQSRPHVSSNLFRQTVYDQGWWALPIDQMQITPARFRNVSPGFFHGNPACTHRLVPWLNRELVALLRNHESQIMFVLELMLSLIQRYEILSPEFREHIRPYISNRTDHFIHEFYNFARSPWDMVAYDHHVIYQNSYVVNSSSRDNDVVILSPNESSVVSINESSLNSSHENRPSVITENANQNEPNPTLFPDQGNANDEQGYPNQLLGKVKKFLSNVSTTNEWDSPSTVSFSPDWNSSMQTSPSTGEVHPAPVSSSPQPGPSGINHSSVLVKESSDSESSNDDDCYIVGYVKPIKDRSPLIIDLVSDSNEETEKSKTKDVSSQHHSDRHSKYPKEKNFQRYSSSGSSSKEREPFSSRNEKHRTSKRSSYHRSRSSSSSSCAKSNALDNNKMRSLHASRCSSYEKSSRSKYYQRTRTKSRSRSPQHWRWTAYESGGGKLQRTFSSSEDVLSIQSSSKEHSTHHSLKKKHNKHKHRKHKKHKHKHKSSHKEDKYKIHKP